MRVRMGRSRRRRRMAGYRTHSFGARRACRVVREASREVLPRFDVNPGRTLPRTPRTLLVTGGAGFIGSAFVRGLFGPLGFQGRVVNLDALTYAGNPENVKGARSEEHTSELQSLAYLVCRLLLEKKKKQERISVPATSNDC